MTHSADSIPALGRHHIGALVRVATNLRYPMTYTPVYSICTLDGYILSSAVGWLMVEHTVAVKLFGDAPVITSHLSRMRSKSVELMYHCSGSVFALFMHLAFVPDLRELT